MRCVLAAAPRRRFDSPTNGLIPAWTLPRFQPWDGGRCYAFPEA